MRGDIDDAFALSAFTPAEMLRGLGLCLRRLDAVEALRRKDRLRLQEYAKECSRLKSKHEEIAKILESAKTNALYAAPAPSVESLKLHGEPRPMSLPELEWVQKTLETNIKHNDPRLPEISKITQTPPSAKGEMTIDFASATTRTQWQLYYLLRHKRIVRRTKSITDTVGSEGVHSLRVMPATSEQLQACAPHGAEQAWQCVEDEGLEWHDADDVDMQLGGDGAIV